jgi:hypothetical protein
VDQRPSSIEGRREKCGVLVLGRLQDVASLPLHEVTRLGQTYERPSGGVSDIDDEVLVTDTGDPRVLDPPVLLETVRAWLQPPNRVDLPTRQPVFTGRRDKRGEAGAVLDAQQQQRSAIDDCGARVEHRVDHVGEVVRAQDWVALEALEQLTWVRAVAHWPDDSSLDAVRAWGRIADRAMRAQADLNAVRSGPTSAAQL